MTALSRFATLLGLPAHQAEDALYSERSARHVLSRRGFFGVSAAMVMGTAFCFVGGWREIEHERIMREVHEATTRYFNDLLSRPIVVPPGVNVECISSPDELLRDKRLTVRVTVQPLSWCHAQRLLSEGFEFA